MLTIYSSTQGAISWKVGQPIPGIASGWNNITMIEADGKELKHIIKRFTNKTVLKAPKEVAADPPLISVESVSIPVPQGKVGKWAGDFAKTVFLNL